MTSIASVVKICVEVARGRVPVIAGAGSNNTAEADRPGPLRRKGRVPTPSLVVTPYYNKPNQRGLYRPFRGGGRGDQLPIIIYNIPGRSVIDMTPETMGAAGA